MTEEQFTAFIREYAALIWRDALCIARRRKLEAADLRQTALLVMWRDHGKAAGQPNPEGWLIQAARWAMLNHADRQGRRAAVPLDAQAHATAFSATDPEPDEWETLVGFLDPAAAELVRRRFADDLTFAELAGELGITPAGVRGRVETALEHLRRHLTP